MVKAASSRVRADMRETTAAEKEAADRLLSLSQNLGAANYRDREDKGRVFVRASLDKVPPKYRKHLEGKDISAGFVRMVCCGLLINGYTEDQIAGMMRLIFT
jgi:hypothetical protein